MGANGKRNINQGLSIVRQLGLGARGDQIGQGAEVKSQSLTRRVWRPLMRFPWPEGSKHRPARSAFYGLPTNGTLRLASAPTHTLPAWNRSSPSCGLPASRRSKPQGSARTARPCEMVGHPKGDCLGDLVGDARIQEGFDGER
jgi:hypothetical protein